MAIKEPQLIEKDFISAQMVLRIFLFIPTHLIHPVRNKAPRAADAMPMAGRISNGVNLIRP
jgi:hypothetical protein